MFRLSSNITLAVLGFIILSPGGCSLEFMEKQDNFRTKFLTNGRNPEQSSGKSILSADDVSTTVNTVMKITNTSLIFLYGEDYEDVLSNLTQFLNEKAIQLMNLKNEGMEEHLGRFFRMLKKKHYLMILDTPDNIISLFQKMRQKRLETHKVKWILLMEGSNAHESIPRLEEFVNEGTQVVIFFKTSGGHLDLYLPSVDSYGITRFTTGSTVELERTFSEALQLQPYSVRGRHFKIGIKEFWFVLEVGKTFPDGSLELVSGIEFKVLNLLSSNLNFTYKAFFSPDDIWGDLMPDGNVTGLIGMVARREATIAMSGLTITSTRNMAVDFPYHYNSARYLLMSRSPKQRTKSLAILSPFKLQVWVCLISTVLLIGPVAFLVSYLARKCLEYKVRKTDLQWFQFNMFRNVVNQENEICDDSHPVRIFLSLWFLFCAIVSALYSGMLTAVLAIPAYEAPIDSLHDLPRAIKEGYTVGTLGGSAYENLFKFATEGVLRQTWNLFNHEDRSKSFLSSPLQSIDRILNEKFIFITSGSHARVFRKMHGHSLFHLSRERLSPTFISIACQVGSPVARALTRTTM